MRIAVSDQHSGPGGQQPPDPGWQLADLTARARIRDAAIECFAESGFATPFRTIAERAGVSPGLITHHFGSKAQLRAQCDTEVLRRYTAVKRDSVAAPREHLLAGLAAPATSATLLVYMLRAIHAGGDPAREFLEQLVDDMRPVMAQAVATGLVRPSRDEEARLRYLTYQTMGAMLVRFLVAPESSPQEFVASMMGGPTEVVLPMLELMTEGYLTTSEMLDGYLQYLWEPPDEPAEPGPDLP